jgi:hypothetical protein
MKITVEMPNGSVTEYGSNRGYNLRNRYFVTYDRREDGCDPTQDFFSKRGDAIVEAYRRFKRDGLTWVVWDNVKDCHVYAAKV